MRKYKHLRFCFSITPISKFCSTQSNIVTEKQSHNAVNNLIFITIYVTNKLVCTKADCAPFQLLLCISHNLLALGMTLLKYNILHLSIFTELFRLWYQENKDISIILIILYFVKEISLLFPPVAVAFVI